MTAQPTGETELVGPPLEPESGIRFRRSALTELRDVVTDLVRYRELLSELSLRDLRIRYKQAVMGILWAVLIPLVVALSGWIIRLAISYLAGAPLAKAELAGVAIKSLAWSFFVGALGF